MAPGFDNLQDDASDDDIEEIDFSGASIHDEWKS